ncbi:polysaccharide biosynthesis tyrosine autokinase [Puniceibacterium sp. IMCC21224]|uniref:GumC family protein n=1 Tax=Puniceibacterium sp. IMCC21224 TaxID=1618204 RepID=UPI00064D9705|nr:polysaccharide biosynthesis tyrosine autokinase [Puniceibacterium sp. IMCC21224]KMK63835.1 uncharacterized protein involved in exopolysaccharide biosynthesis [Puniceibacterium sp. IMCC21224]
MNKTLPSRRLPTARNEPRDIAPEGDFVDLGALLRTLWRGKLLIAFATGVALLIGGYWAYVAATPLYSATAVVMLNNREEQVVDFQSVIGGLGSDSSVVNTEVEVLKSRSLLGKVVDRLDLTQDPEFNSALRPPLALTRLKQTVRSLLPAEPVQITMRSPEEIARQVRDNTVNGLLGKLNVRNIPQSLVFRVSIETGNPRKSARIADTLVDLYILTQLESKFEATEQATSWLTDRVAQLQVQLEEAETRVTNFRSGTDLINLESLEAQERQIKDLRDRIGSTRITRDMAVQRLDAIHAADTPAAQAEASGDQPLQQYLSRIDDAPIRQSFDARLEQVVTRATLEVQRAENQLAALTASQADLEAQLDSQSNDLITLQQLTREAEASRLLYEYFLARLKETSAQQGIQQADSRIISDAVPPSSAASPRKSLILLISAVLGAIAGMALVLLRELRHDSFRTADTIETTTGYPVMGQVPMLPSRRRKDAIRYLSERPTSAAAEAVRNLRTSVLLSNVDNPPQVIATSSSLPGEGKTTLSLALSQNLAGMGKKVLLIEGDIRRRVMSTYISDDANTRTGLIAVLTGQQTLSETVIHDETVGADILLGGKSSVNAADLFSSDRFHALLDEARKTYDQIIIDTPPVLVVPDARIIAQVADALLFAVKWDSTSQSQVIEALRMFESVNHPVSGIVLNQISPRGMKRYGYGDKYGAYAAYGRKYYVN